MSENPDGRRTARVRWGLGLSLSAAVLVLLIGGFELVFRSTLDEEQRRELESMRLYVLHGTAGHFVGRPYTSFGRPLRGEETGLRTTRYNRFGFNDGKWTLRKKPGVHRIVCLGGSTTEGGNPDGHAGSFPYQLEDLLNEASDLEFEVMNCGVSGWTTAETMVAYFLLLQDFEPDLVILHHVSNDVYPRNYPNYRSDYLHYRRPWQTVCVGPLERFLIRRSAMYAWNCRFRRRPPEVAQLSTHPRRGQETWDGEKLPRATVRAFLRNQRTIAEHAVAHGARVLLTTMPFARVDESSSARMLYAGILEHNEILREMSRRDGHLLCDLEQLCADEEASWRPEFLDKVHLTKQGNGLKARHLADLLLKEWIPELQGR